MKARIHLVAGARPNFMKIGPLYHALAASDWAEPIFVHTGQHYDPLMSEVFLRDIGLPLPHVHLGASGDSHATMTADVMVAYEKALKANPPDYVVVAGDVDSTLGAALATRKLNLRLAHLEAGLRSFDRTMPEEINRRLTDAMSDLLWTPSEDADLNLAREGIDSTSIVRIGNVMIDAYVRLESAITGARVPNEMGLSAKSYLVATLHRPANVDDPVKLALLLDSLGTIAADIPITFPVHPRTRKAMKASGISVSKNIKLLEPMSYIRFMSLIRDAAAVITDSGGIQEETTYLGIPCLTLRESTERPVTITHGTNRLVQPADLATAVRTAISAPRGSAPSIPLWDGHAAERAARSLKDRVG